MRLDRPLIQCATDFVSAHYTSYDMIETPCHATHSRHSSASTTDDSSPVTPTFSARTQSRYSSTNSSAASLPPPHHETLDLNPAHRKTMPVLPNLVEDPMEREIPSDDVFAASSCNWNQSRASWVPAAFFASHIEYDMRDGFSSDSEMGSDHTIKRRKSGDSAMNSFATRIVTRFPSLSKRSRDRKRFAMPLSETSSPVTTLSRSSSFARSFRTRSREFILPTAPVAVAIPTIAEDVPASPQVQTMDYSYEDDEAAREFPDPLIRSSTPLLPPLMMDMHDKSGIQSPLQSPTIAAPADFRSHSSTPTPSTSGFTSPALMSTPSLGTFQRSSTTPSTPPSELPPMLIADPNDEWAEKLGHANFEITPAPYLPKQCTLASCKRLLEDWEVARAEFSKHLARTSTHFGPGSKIYKLTEQKWAVIDAAWRRNNDLASLRAVRNGETPPGHTPIEPAPVTKIPNLDISQSEGKFPKLGDDDIVGPMVQVASQCQLKRKPTKKAKFLSMMGLRGERR